MDEFEAEGFPEEALDLIFFTLAIESFQGIIFLIGLAIVLRASFGITKIESFHGRWVIFYCVLIFIGTGILDLILEYYLDFEIYFYAEPILLTINAVSFFIAAIYFAKLVKYLHANIKSANKAI
ncbi:hypothetical protein NBRC116493_35680 [Aurantivibrio infirmus]